MEVDYRSDILEAESLEKVASQFLYELYEITERNQLLPVNMFELCTNLCLTQEETIDVIAYLKERRLIRSMGYQTVGITMDGIEMVESS
ncbi:MAG: hypothetical protein ACYC9O_13585 [Candidatus Latescibacterota bacterium]